MSKAEITFTVSRDSLMHNTGNLIDDVIKISMRNIEFKKQLQNLSEKKKYKFTIKIE